MHLRGRSTCALDAWGAECNAGNGSWVMMLRHSGTQALSPEPRPLAMGLARVNIQLLHRGAEAADLPQP